MPPPDLLGQIPVITFVKLDSSSHLSVVLFLFLHIFEASFINPRVVIQRMTMGKIQRDEQAVNP